MEKPETDEVDKYLEKNLVLRENMLESLLLMLHMLMVILCSMYTETASIGFVTNYDTSNIGSI